MRCTEEKPICKRCQRLGLECAYGLKLLWEEDAVQQNIAHGRAGPLIQFSVLTLSLTRRIGVWSRDGRPKSRSKKNVSFLSNHDVAVSDPCHGSERMFLNFTMADFEGGGFDAINRQGEHHHHLEDDQDIEEVSRQDMSPDADSLALEMFDTSGFETFLGIEVFEPRGLYQGTDAHLLAYYINELCPKCSLSEVNNPYLSVLLPIAYEFAPLRHALLAVAANQLRLLDDHRFVSHSLTLKSMAMKGLRYHLATDSMDWRSLATILMFCFYDVCKGRHSVLTLKC